MLTFYRAMVWLTLYCRIYYLWSKLYRLFYDRKYDDTRLPMYDKLEHLETVLGQMVWQRDGWRSLWDAITTPEAAWAKHKMGKPAGDCLPEGTLLLTADYRFVPIEQVMAGDVIIGNGTPTKVLKSWSKGDKPMLEFDLTNGGKLRCTAGHRVFVRRGGYGAPGAAKKIIEVKAEQVCVGDFLLHPEEAFPCAGGRTTQTERDDAWLLGLFVADGWHEGNRFAISGKDGHPKEVNKKTVEKMCDERGIRTTMSRRFIRIYDREMCETMAACGKGALNKTVPNLASRKKAVVRSILRGLEADASVVKSSGTLTFGTISTELALQLRVMYRMLGISTHMRLVVNHGGLGKNPIWRITPRVKNRGTVVKVKAISAVEPGPVWDVMTEDGYIYLPETDVVVHNCDDISIFAVSRLLNMARRGELVYLGVQPWGQHCNIGLLSVPWFDMGTRKTGGHNVAVLKYVDHDSGEDRWGHMSNWYSGRIAWGFKSLEDVVRIVCGGKKSLGWALADLKLKRWVYGRGSKI